MHCTPRTARLRHTRVTPRLAIPSASRRPPRTPTARAHASLPSTRRRHASSGTVCNVTRALTSRTARWPAPRSTLEPPRFALRVGRRCRSPFGRCCCPYGSRPAQSDRLLDSPLDATKPNEARERDVSATFARRRPTRAAGDQRRRRGRAARGRDARTRTDISAAPPHELWSVLYIYIICMYDTTMVCHAHG